MKGWTTLILLTVSLLGWSAANAEYDPNSYVYGRFVVGLNMSGDWTGGRNADSGSDVGTNIGIGYVRNLSEDWNLFGGVRYEYFNYDWGKVVHSEGDSYLSHWGLNLEWRPNYTPDSYFFANIFFGPNGGHNWVDSGATGSGFGMGYTRILLKKYNIFGTARYEHYSHLMAGAPFNDKDESHLDHFGVGLEMRW